MIRPSAWFLLVGLALPAFAAEDEPDASSEFRKGFALFTRHCVKCHTLGEGDRVGPDLKGVAGRRNRDWLIGFIRTPGTYLDSDPFAKQLLEKYGGVRMTDLGLSREEVVAILTYIRMAGEGPAGGGAGNRRLEERNLAREVPGPDEGMGLHLPGVTGAGVMLAAAIALGILRRPRAAQIVAVLSAALGYWSLGGRAHHRLPGDHQGYAPEQPIAFSHRLHAGELGIGCLYCHAGAEKGPVAGIPAVQVCMNCHRLVKNRAGEPGTSPELARLFAAWDSRASASPASIPWVRVHNLPDFVTFTHEAHVRNGIVCQTCHGPVQDMDRVRQASDLSMGWCVNCHRKTGAAAPTHWKRTDASLDCTTCHQ